MPSKQIQGHMSSNNTPNINQRLVNYQLEIKKGSFWKANFETFINFKLIITQVFHLPTDKAQRFLQTPITL